MFFSLTIQDAMKEEAGLAIPLEQLRFDAFLLLTRVVDTQISKNLGHRQN